MHVQPVRQPRLISNPSVSTIQHGQSKVWELSLRRQMRCRCMIHQELKCWSKPKDWWMRRYVYGTSEQIYMSCTINSQSYSIAWHNVLIFANYLLSILQNLLWDLPHCNIYSLMCTDLLHQIHRGVFCHLMDWFKTMIKSLYDIRTANQYLDQFDKRFATIPAFTGIKKFQKGIAETQYTTGREWADIFKVCT